MDPTVSTANTKTDDQPPPPMRSIRAGLVVAGRYKLLQPLGEGGMGAVWLAEQTEPVKRLVALKVIKDGRDSKQVLARFEAERQALALMDHPGIARVFDGGAIDGRDPYFVMELVRGKPITEYCDARQLTVEDRLKLFMQVCAAVQHAHQKGILHRDLKPSNILVEDRDGKPAPKVIDFGLAKALSRLPLTDLSLETQIGALVGTPLYMAPEQADFSAFDIDTRADIYALGVLLYELLTGSTPIERKRLAQAAWDEIRRLIREEEPPTPSTRLSSDGSLASVAAMRHTEPLKLNRLVRGDLDWIAMKALAKERDRRYDTAAGFAQDIERFLNHEPVFAGPPTASYRVRKFIRRNRPQVVAGSLILCALLAGIVGTTFGMLEADRQRDAALKAKEKEGIERGKAEALAASETKLRKTAEDAEADTSAFSRFLVNQVLSASRPTGIQLGIGVDVKMSDALLAAEKHVDRVFAGRPRAEAEARQALGVTFRNLGRFADAERHLRRAIVLWTDLKGPEDETVLDASNSLAVAISHLDKVDEAIAFHERNVEIYKRRHGPNHAHTRQSLLNLAADYATADRTEEAVAILESLRRSAADPADPQEMSQILSFLAQCHRGVFRFAEAVKAQEQAVEIATKAFGRDGSTTLIARTNLAHTMVQAGRPKEGLAALEELAGLMERNFGPEHRDTLSVLSYQANALCELNRLEEGAALFERHRAAMRRVFGEGSTTVIVADDNLGTVLRDLGRIGEATAFYEELVGRSRRSLGADHMHTRHTEVNLATCYRRQARHEEAIPLLENVFARQKTKPGPDDRSTLVTQHYLAGSYRMVGRFHDAIALYEDLAPRNVRIRKPGEVDITSGFTAWLEACEAARLPKKEVEAARQYVAYERGRLKEGDAGLATPLMLYGVALLRAGEPIPAEAALRESLALREKHTPQVWSIHWTRSTIGEALLDQDKYEEAAKLLQPAYEILRENQNVISPGFRRLRLEECLDRVVRLHVLTKNKAEEAKWKLEYAKLPLEPLPVPRAVK